MRRLRLLLRLMRIQYVFIRHGLDQLIFSLHLFRPLYFLSFLNPFNWFRHPEQTRGERIRRSLEDLGPIFVKFGQMLSTRRDLLPNDITQELAMLQDKVPPFVGARKVVEESFGQSVDELFIDFEEHAMASASIAQVHAAKLPSGEEVVVKVLRPGVEKKISRDIELMYAIAYLVRRYVSDSKRFKPVEVVAEFERNLSKETDFLYEAANASQIRRNFENDDYLYIPQVYWDYSKSDVLTLERIYGIPIAQVDKLKAANVNLKKMAELGVRIFFTQVFRDCFFHADMHPGNLFVDPADPEKPRVIAVDFGIVGSLTPTDQRYLAENMLAFFNRDYRRVAQLHVESGWVPKETPINEFEAAIRTTCEPIFERPLKDISIAKVLLRLFQTAREFQMEVQPQLTLLQKTLINVEGLGRELYDDLDLWATCKPYLEKWLRSQMGVRAALRKSRAFLPYWLEKMPDMPEMIFQTLTKLNTSPLVVDVEQPEAPENTTFWRFLPGVCLGVIVTLAAVYAPQLIDYLTLNYRDFLLGSLTGGLGVSLLVLSQRKR